jgi:hypothetical protein
MNWVMKWVMTRGRLGNPMAIRNGWMLSGNLGALPVDQISKVIFRDAA